MASIADEPLDPALAMVARAWDPAKEMVSYLHNYANANDGLDKWAENMKKRLNCQEFNMDEFWIPAEWSSSEAAVEDYQGYSKVLNERDHDVNVTMSMIRN
jgi:hypothetical protein